MKYYSEKTKKYYDDEKSCVSAEKEYDKAHAVELRKAEERKEAAKKVEDAYKKAAEACKEYNKILNEFVDEYGSYHMTVTDRVPTFSNLFDTIFRLF